MNATISQQSAESRARAGFFYGLAAYGLWGVMPVYFKWLKAVPSIDIVAHRIVWSLIVLIILVSVARAWDQIRSAVRSRKAMAMLFLTALLIGTNWLLYVYAINSGHILAGSLGYYLNPLANILLGRFILKERLTKLQWTAVAPKSPDAAFPPPRPCSLPQRSQATVWRTEKPSIARLLKS